MNVPAARTLLAAALVFCLPSSARAQNPASLENSSQSVAESNGVAGHEWFETGYARPGSAVHRWVASLGYPLADDSGFKYEFYSKNAKAGSSESLLARLEKAGSFPKTISFTPDQPSQGGQIGETWVNTPPCLIISDGIQQGTATITITWERRYTTDSDNDGENDSNPQWQVASFSATNIEWHTNGAALCP